LHSTISITPAISPGDQSRQAWHPRCSLMRRLCPTFHSQFGQQKRRRSFANHNDVLKWQYPNALEKGRWVTTASEGESLRESTNDSSRFALILTAAFAVLETLNILRHAMWRDELYVWALCRRANSIGELLYLKRYDGHPDAWYLLVYPLTRLTGNPFAMQMLHLVLASATVYVIAACAPFSRLQKVLLVFGYFFFYEYATISRVYALSILCVFCYCAVFRPGPRKDYPALALLLAIMAQANIYALILAVALVLGILVEAITSDAPREYWLGQRWRAAGAAAFFGSSVVVSVLRMQTPADSGYLTTWFLRANGDRLIEAMGMMWNSFVPIPVLSAHFWNTNIVTALPIAALLSVVVFCVSILYFLRQPAVLATYVAGLGALLLFKYLKVMGDVRHDGHAFILFLACLWLGSQLPESKAAWHTVTRVAVWFVPQRQATLYAILAVQLVAAGIASAISYRVPFSQSKAVVQYLRANQLDGMLIVGDLDYPLISVAAYLNREIYYPRGDRMGSYVIWDKRRLYDPAKPVLQIAKEKALAGQQDVLLILNYPLPVSDPSVRPLAIFTGSIVGDEDYVIYRVPYVTSSPEDSTHP